MNKSKWSYLNLDRRPGIYKITNINMNKIYIGSSVKVRDRVVGHLNQLEKQEHINTYLQNAYNKYGKESFKFEVLEYLEDKEKLLEREQYYLDLYKSYDSDIGYNLCPKADSHLGFKNSERGKENNRRGQKTRPVYQLDLEGNIIQYWFGGANEIDKKTQYKRSLVRSAILNKKIRYNYIWVFVDEYDNFNINEYVDGGTCGYTMKTVLQYDLDGNLISEFRSMTSASNCLSLSYEGIRSCCIGRIPSYKGYVFKHKQ